jgi:uncharacterized protein YkwD
MQKKRWFLLIVVMVWVGWIRASEWSLPASSGNTPDAEWNYVAATLDPLLLGTGEPEPKPTATIVSTETSLPPTLTPESASVLPYDAPEEILMHAEQKQRLEMVEVVPTAAYPDMVLELYQLMNEERAKVNAPALELSPVLNRVAQEHSDEMAKHNFFGHDSLNGLTFVNRIRNAGYRFSSAAENLFAGNGPYDDAAYVINTWLRSTSHRENMLNPVYTEVGIGYRVNPDSTYGAYFTADFGTP